jgi:hypothetical protein
MSEIEEPPTPQSTPPALISTLAEPVAKAEGCPPLVFRLHGDSRLSATIAVRPGMNRDELEACIVFAFAGHHAIQSAKGVYSGTHAAGCLLPLGVVAADPTCVRSGECILAVHPPYIRRAPRPMWPRLLGGALVALLLAALVFRARAAAGGSLSFTALLEPPLRQLYRSGPQFALPSVLGGFSVGFWEGASQHDVCARVTSHDASFWSQHPAECASIYRKKEDGYVLLVEYGLLFFVLWKLANAALGGVLAMLNPLNLVKLLWPSASSSSGRRREPDRR